MSRDPVEQITQHIDKTDDLILVILRAHLLVEERLRDILAQISRAPEELKAARLSFHQALCLFGVGEDAAHIAAAIAARG